MEGIGQLRRSELAQARPGLERLLAAGRDHGDPFVETFAAVSVANLELVEGRHDAARRVLAESRARIERSARGRCEGMDLMDSAIALAEGDAADVAAKCEAWGPTIDQLGFAFLTAWRLTLLTRALVETAEVDKARPVADMASLVAEQSGNPWLQLFASEQRATLLRAAGDAVEAEDVVHQALAIATEHGFDPDIALCIELLAGLAVAGESWAEGVRLGSAAEAWRRVSHCQAWPLDERRLRADLDLARTALGDDASDAAWTDGAALSLDEAVAYARRARGERRRPSTGWASLTPTETDVVRLVAEGLSNPDIAARLFVSRATVKTHLIHVFSKLGVGSRAELAVAATRRGIGDAR
jgi:DNA-binding CsgD family transcriptional regulator